MHLIREELKAVQCPIGLIDHGPVMGTTHELCMWELNPFHIFWFCLSSTRPPLVPYFMRALPFQVGLGPCVLR